MKNLGLRFEPATLRKWHFTTVLLSRRRESLSRELNNKLEQDYCRFQGRIGRGSQSPTCHWHVLWITPIQSDTTPSLYLQHDRFHWTDYILLDKLELRTEVLDTTSTLLGLFNTSSFFVHSGAVRDDDARRPEQPTYVRGQTDPILTGVEDFFCPALMTPYRFQPERTWPGMCFVFCTLRKNSSSEELLLNWPQNFSS